MSTFRRIKEKCYVCGHESEQTIIMSTNRFGSPDLDLRPPEMMRSTMRHWLHMCPKCKYVAESLDNSTNATAEYLEILDTSADQIFSDRCFGADVFYIRYNICQQDGDLLGSFKSALHTAWVCDDYGDDEYSQMFRDIALERLEALEKKSKINDNIRLMKADILRRAGHFDQVISEYENVRFSSNELEKIRLFQIEKAKKKDDRCYTLADVE